MLESKNSINSSINLPQNERGERMSEADLLIKMLHGIAEKSEKLKIYSNEKLNCVLHQQQPVNRDSCPTSELWTILFSELRSAALIIENNIDCVREDLERAELPII